VKYIFNAFDGHEEFFDLHADPGEERNLAMEGARGAEVKVWRERLVRHLSVRGTPWVVHGELGLRKESILYSVNYPRG
jgi:hypothetical protein